MAHLRSALLIIFISLLAGCSQRTQDLNATIHEALFGFNDVNMTAEQVAELPYASIYARINNGHQIFMVLAFADTNPLTGNTQLKWVSADSAMITTENGRIVKTAMFPKANLVNMSSNNRLAAPNQYANSWSSREYDWQPGYLYSNKARIESMPKGTEKITSLLWQKQTTQVHEVITFDQIGQQMQNDYWVDTQGNVVKSAQWLIPDELFIEIEVLKPYAE